MNIRTHTRLILLALLACLAYAPATYAQGPIGTFQVTATVDPACSVSANPLAFGMYSALSPNAVERETSLQITCTNGSPSYTVALSNGDNFNQVRQMKHGTSDYLHYELYSDSGRNTRWGNGSTMPGIGTQAFSVYGRLFAGQNAPGGDYVDTITVTVTYN